MALAADTLPYLSAVPATTLQSTSTKYRVYLVHGMQYRLLTPRPHQWQSGTYLLKLHPSCNHQKVPIIFDPLSSRAPYVGTWDLPSALIIDVPASYCSWSQVDLISWPSKFSIMVCVCFASAKQAEEPSHPTSSYCHTISYERQEDISNSEAIRSPSGSSSDAAAPTGRGQ